MKPVFLGILAGLFTVSHAQNNINPEWVDKVRLSLGQINKIFGLITIDPTAPDNSDELFLNLLAYDTFQDFSAVAGFGYAFQDQIISLADDIYSPVQSLQ